jgi:hypothetical protein
LDKIIKEPTLKISYVVLDSKLESVSPLFMFSMEGFARTLYIAPDAVSMPNNCLPD